MGLIIRTFTYLDETSFLLLYKAFVRPQLDYANPVWNPHRIDHITTIENVQRRATKLVPPLRNLTYEDRLRKLQLPTLAYRRLRGDMIELYKNFNIYDQDTAVKVNRSFSNTRGHDYKLQTSRANKDIGKYAFTTRVVNPWNSLTNSIVSAPNLITFEARLDRHWKGEHILFNFKAPLPGDLLTKSRIERPI